VVREISKSKKMLNLVRSQTIYRSLAVNYRVVLVSARSFSSSTTSKKSPDDEKNDPILSPQPTITKVAEREHFDPRLEMLRNLKRDMQQQQQVAEEDGKPSKEYMDLFTKLASQLKQTDITAKQQLLNSPKSQDFRALVAKRKANTQKGIRYTSDELKVLFNEMQHGKFPVEQDVEKLRRILNKYELIE
jgi:hypothetical protein